MISYISGIYAGHSTDAVVIECGGIGFCIRVPETVLNRLPAKNSEFKLYTYLHVKEDAMQLYGFLKKDDLHVFQLLLGVNGIGPKAALGILSVLSANDIRFAVLAGDAKAISRAPGIGAKSAQKIILELKDKFDLQETFDSSLAETENDAVVTAGDRQIQDEAVQALVALGYPAGESLKAVRSVQQTENMTTEDLLKAALRNMSF